MQDEPFLTEFPSFPDEEMQLNAWIFDHDTVGHIVRLFPSYQGNFTIYVAGYTVGD